MAARTYDSSQLGIILRSFVDAVDQINAGIDAVQNLLDLNDAEDLAADLADGGSVLPAGVTFTPAELLNGLVAILAVQTAAKNALETGTNQEKIDMIRHNFLVLSAFKLP